MVTNHRPTFHPDERVDLIDFLAAIVHGSLETTRQQHVVYEPASHDYALLFDGFSLSIHGGGTGVAVDLSGDPAIFGTESRDGDLHPGRISGSEQGLATQELLLTNFTPPPIGASVYDLYIRLAFQLSDEENRLFWDRTANQETSLLTTTKAQAYYVLTAVVTGSPNPYPGQAHKLGEVTVDGTPLVTSVASTRHFFFEGPEASDFSPDTVWGDGANDRNDTREADGVKDLYTMNQMVRRQLADIMGEGDPGAFPAATTKKPWGAVLNNLPSLYTLSLDHWPAGAASAAKHKQVRIAGNPNTPSTYVTFEDNVGVVPAAAIVHGGDSFFADMAGNLLLGAASTVGPTLNGFMIRIVSNGPATAGGLVLGHGDGQVNRNLNVAEKSHLRFGNPFDGAGWDQGDDYAFVAVGGASDTARELHVEVGAAQVGAWMNGGDFRLTGTKNFGYLTDRAFLRCFNPSDFMLKDGTPHSASGLLVSDSSMGGAGGITDQWFRVNADVSGPAQTDGWALVNTVGTNDPAGVLEPDHLLSGSAWLAQGMKVELGDDVVIDCECDNNFDTNDGALQLVLCRMAGGVWQQIAYAEVLATTTRGRRTGQWAAAGSHPGGTTYTMDLTSYTYGLILVPTETNAPGPATGVTGQVAVYGVTAAFRVKETFGH